MFSISKQLEKSRIKNFCIPLERTYFKAGIHEFKVNFDSLIRELKNRNKEIEILKEKVLTLEATELKRTEENKVLRIKLEEVEKRNSEVDIQILIELYFADRSRLSSCLAIFLLFCIYAVRLDLTNMEEKPCGVLNDSRQKDCIG